MLGVTNQVPATWFAATAGIRRLASPVRRPLPPGAVAAFSGAVRSRCPTRRDADPRPPRARRTDPLLTRGSGSRDLDGPLQDPLGAAQGAFGFVDGGDEV